MCLLGRQDDALLRSKPTQSIKMLMHAHPCSLASNIKTPGDARAANRLAQAERVVVMVVATQREVGGSCAECGLNF